MKEETLLQKFKNFITNEKLFSFDQKILVAVSGGIDSMVMGDLFKNTGIDFAIIHCNFQLRGEHSDQDETLVHGLAEKYKVSIFSKRFETLQYQIENKLSLEVAARELRYEYFEDIRLNFGYHLIATAHHHNDNIETTFFNLIKGTGIKGVTGIPVKNGKIIRPLLFATRAEIEQYALQNSIDFNTDVSNLSNEFDRNLIRNEIIPLLKKINPSLEKTMHNNIVHFKEVEKIYRIQIQKKLNSLMQVQGDDIYISVAALRNLPAVTTYLHEFLHPYHFNEDQIKTILSCLGETGKVFYSVTHRVILDRKNLILTPLNTQENSVVVINKENKTISCNDFKLHFEESKFNAQMHFNETGNIAYFDAALIKFPLLLRNWQIGDYLYPLGLTKKKSDKPGKKKVSDILSNAKYNLLQKEKTKVLLSGDKIIWVLGLRQDDRFKITDKTTRLLKIKMLPD